MRAGRRPHLVTLEDRPKDGKPATVLSPDALFVEVVAGQGQDDEARVVHTVMGPWHPQVNTETVLGWAGVELFVVGVQNVGGRSREMVLVCHEVRTP